MKIVHNRWLCPNMCSEEVCLHLCYLTVNSIS